MNESQANHSEKSKDLSKTVLPPKVAENKDAVDSEKDQLGEKVQSVVKMEDEDEAKEISSAYIELAQEKGISEEQWQFLVEYFGSVSKVRELLNVFYGIKLEEGKIKLMNLDFQNDTNLRSLPEGLVIYGDLDLMGCTNLASLPRNLLVKNLHIDNCTSLTSLPEDLEVEVSLSATNCTALRQIPQGFKAGYKLALRGCTSLTSLPDNFTTHQLDLSDCTDLRSLPKGLYIASFLNLNGCTSLSSLPEDLFVQQSLTLINCTGLSSLPKNLRTKELRISDNLNEQVKQDAKKLKEEGKISVISYIS